MTLAQNPVLKPCTIIPTALYVERAADRQLARILNDMGRPGYVLVARQMGKTNLLLNAKRTMAGGPDKFVYADVSNIAPDLRTFFRMLIDTCIDSFPEALREASERIEIRRRSTRQLLEHKEHELELRDILQASDGRLVICLDEIDALTKTDYSDQVFSLIRSIYFSGRTNFVEFARLTYVLSGVAEPTEIIKNRSISPFNIGEKIYLEDFSREEFNGFVRKAGLPLSEGVIDTIFSWTGGNPRMTWDLCSAIETYDGDITSTTVDQIVDKLYLSTFDLPPIDHIRTLVETDKEVRSAVMELHYGKSTSISDQIKSRLYLSGIIATPDPSSSIRIKNRIIESALSEKWIEGIERSEHSALEYANRLFAELRYAEALTAYRACEDEGTIGDADLFALRKGTCQYFTTDYTGAIQTLTSQPFPKSRSVDFYVASRSKIANAHLILGNLEDSIAAFEKLIGEFGPGEDQPLSFYQAKLNLSSAYLALTPPNAAKAKELCRSVIAPIANTAASQITPEMLERYQCVAHYNVCVAELKEGNRPAAREAIDKAIDHASRSDRATLMLERAKEFEHGAARVEAVIDCAQYCIENRVAISAGPDAERQLAFSIDRAASLILELEFGSARATKALSSYLSFCLDSQVGHEVSVHRVIMMAANFAFAQQRNSVALKLYSDGARLSESLESTDYWSVFAFNLAVCPADEIADYRERFASRVATSGVGSEAAAIRAAHRVLRTFLSDKRAEEADELLNSLGVTELDLSQPNRSFEGLVDQFYRLCTNVALQRTTNLRSDVRALFNALNDYSGPKPELYSPDYTRHLIGQLMSMCPQEFAPKTMHRSNPKLGRNEVVVVRLTDGSTERGKYKRFESLLRDGRATLLDQPE
ncbi:AAA-like domain-containing protein [Pseudoxanthomonas sp. Soil82]|uniref:AAA-like domain-containing protein n=1 Tax=Pseudoxanthomonas sp. Soil82 TaxID=3157341 RepID=UPI00338FF01C